MGIMETSYLVIEINPREEYRAGQGPPSSDLTRDGAPMSCDHGSG